MRKMDLKSLVKPTSFRGSITVLLLIAGITLYILGEKEKTLRMFVQKQLTRTAEEKNMIERKIGETVVAKKKVEKKLAVEKNKSFVLEKELEQKKREIKFTLDRLENEIAVRRHVEAQLILAMKAKNDLEEKIGNLSEVSKTVELESIVVTKPAYGLIGRVIGVNKEHSFVLVDLGREDNLEMGNVLSIYRNDEFIGKIQAERVEKDFCAATILPEWRDTEFKENDVVKVK